MMRAPRHPGRPSLSRYIMRKMAMQKKLKEKKAAQGGGAVATPAGNRPRRTPRG